LSGAAALRAVLAAFAAWALVLLVFGALGGAVDPTEQDTTALILVIAGGFLAAAAGTAAGAWQARAAGTRAPGLGLLVPALTVVALGVLLTATGGGASEDSDTTLIYLAFPLGALAGAVLYGRRWLAAAH
jgi:hypothetical protein